MTDRVRVLVIDDSAYLRKALSAMLSAEPSIEVVGTARNGIEGMAKIAELDPHVVTLDLMMPELDGVGFLRAQMARRPLPVVVVSSMPEDSAVVLDALEAGAVDFIRKPTALSTDKVMEIRGELTEKVLAAASVVPERLAARFTAGAESLEVDLSASRPSIDAMVLGISTGGPRALRYLLPLFPANTPFAIAVVVHMPVGYTEALAAKLAELCALEVLEAVDGLAMRPGRIIVARAGWHLKLHREGDRVSARLDLAPPDSPHRPSVDVLFQSAAAAYKSRTLGVVMTGMGNDGTLGAAWIKAAGGRIYAEAEESSLIFGMPRSVIEAGLADRVVHLERMADAILRHGPR